MLRQALRGCGQVVEVIFAFQWLVNENRTIFSQVIDKKVKSDLDMLVQKEGGAYIGGELLLENLRYVPSVNHIKQMDIKLKDLWTEMMKCMYVKTRWSNLKLMWSPPASVIHLNQCNPPLGCALALAKRNL